MKKKIEYNPQQNCPNCGGLHYGTRFDNCPYTKEQGLAFRTGTYTPENKTI